MEVSGICERCNTHAETMIHALWGCNKVKNCWASSPIQQVDYPDTITTFDTLVWWLWAHVSRETLEIFFVLCWGIWNVRNKEVCGNCEVLNSVMKME